MARDGFPVLRAPWAVSEPAVVIRVGCLVDVNMSVRSSVAVSEDELNP